MQARDRQIELIYLGLGAAFGFAMSCFGVAVTVAWVTEAGLGPFQLVLLGSVLEASVFVAEVPTGVVADTLSRKWSIVVSFILVGCGMALNISDVFTVLIIAQFVWGVGFTFQSGATTAWVTDELGREVDDLIISKARWNQVGVMAGLITGAGVGAWSLDGAIAVSAATSIVVAVLAALFMPETGFVPTPPDDRSSWRSMIDTATAGARVLGRYPITRAVITAALIGGFASEVVDRFLVLRLVDLGVPRLDPVVAVGGLLMISRVFVWFALGRIRPRLDTSIDALSVRMIATAYVVTSVGVLALAVGPLFAVAAGGQVLQATARNVVEPIEQAVINRKATSQHRATILSFHGQADAVGQVAGGMSLALVAYVASVSVAMTLAAGLFSVAAIAVWRRSRSS